MLTNKVTAPWTPEQVEALERRQNDPYQHPYTCECGESLEPWLDGWSCDCGYTQDWCHAEDVR